jgi:hypothetical protein
LTKRRFLLFDEMLFDQKSFDKQKDEGAIRGRVTGLVWEKAPKMYLGKKVRPSQTSAKWFMKLYKGYKI